MSDVEKQKMMFYQACKNSVDRDLLVIEMKDDPYNPFTLDDMEKLHRKYPYSGYNKYFYLFK